MKHVFGPVLSRRLGRSLGVDLVPPKTCPLDCVYCECGVTTDLRIERCVFVPTEEVLAEAAEALARLAGRLDWVTLSGSGEPTLAANLGEVIAGLKRLGAPRVALLTNGVLLGRPEVAAAAALADRVSPSLDAARPETFQAVNRPHPDLDLAAVIEGLVSFRALYRGELFLEILLVAGINDSPEEIEALSAAVDRIRPDRIELGTVDRPGTEVWARPISEAALAAAAARFRVPVSLIGYGREVRSTLESVAGFAPGADLAQRVVELVARRPATAAQLAAGLAAHFMEVEKALAVLERTGAVRRIEKRGQVYFTAAAGGPGRQ